MKLANETKHTPAPWFRNIKANGKYPVIFAGRNQHVCTVNQQTTGEETEANIDFIVRAVNSHDELVAFARDIRQAFYIENSSKKVKEVMTKYVDALREIVAAEGKL